MKKRMRRLAAVGLVTVMTGSMLLGCGGEKEKEDGKTSDGKVQLRFATWDVSINLMRARIRLKLYWKDGDLILIQR